MTHPLGPTSQTARAIARAQLNEAILRSAREQLATVGPAQLSLRAVARQVGIVSSAVYRYFPSRDDLLSELLVICFDEVGERVEKAEAQVTDRNDYLGRWLAISHTFHDWAREHPYDFALLYGSPVPGYAAPERTVEPATRITSLLLALLSDQLTVPAAGQTIQRQTVRPHLHEVLADLRAAAGADLPDEWLLAGLQAWSGLIGGVTLELFGHLVSAIEDHDTYFEAAARRMAPVFDTTRR